MDSLQRAIFEEVSSAFKSAFRPAQTLLTAIVTPTEEHGEIGRGVYSMVTNEPNFTVDLSQHFQAIYAVEIVRQEPIEEGGALIQFIAYGMV